MNIPANSNLSYNKHVLVPFILGLADPVDVS